MGKRRIDLHRMQSIVKVPTMFSTLYEGQVQNYTVLFLKLMNIRDHFCASLCDLGFDNEDGPFIFYLEQKIRFLLRL